MTSLLSQFVSRTDFESYEDFQENFKILVPENFNFAYDVVDAYARDSPEKIAMVWCNDNKEEKTFTFKDLKCYSDKAANFFVKHGVGKGDYVMLTLKSRYEFWYCILGLHKLGAIAVPATHMLKTRDIVYRIEKAGLKMIVCISEDDVPEQVDEAHAECGNVPLKKVLVAEVPGKAGLISERNLRKLPLSLNAQQARLQQRTKISASSISLPEPPVSRKWSNMTIPTL